MQKFEPKHFIQSILKFSVSSWINFAIGILSVPIMTRVLSPDLFGAFGIFNTASGLLMAISCLGMDSSFMRFYNEPPVGYDERQLLAVSLLFSIGFLLIISLLCIPWFYQELSFLLFAESNIWIISLLCMQAMSQISLRFSSLYYRMSNDSKNFTIQSVFIQTFSRLFVITAGLLNATKTTILCVSSLAYLFLNLIYLYVQKNEMFPGRMIFSWRSFAPVIKFGLLSWPIVIIVYLNTFLSMLIINLKLGSYELGIFTSASYFVAILGVAQNGFRTYWAGFMYANYKSEQDKIIKVHSCILLFSVVFMAALVVFQHFLYTFLGSQYQEGRVFFAMLLVTPLFQLISETTGYGVSLAHKPQYTMFSITVSTVVNVWGCYLLLPLVGIQGAAIASMLSGSVYLLLSSIFGQMYYVSIDNAYRTIFVSIMIVGLAVTSHIFTNNYLIELGITITTLMCTGLCFRKEIQKILSLTLLRKS